MHTTVPILYPTISQCYKEKARFRRVFAHSPVRLFVQWQWPPFFWRQKLKNSQHTKQIFCGSRTRNVHHTRAKFARSRVDLPNQFETGNFCWCLTLCTTSELRSHSRSSNWVVRYDSQKYKMTTLRFFHTSLWTRTNRARFSFHSGIHNTRPRFSRTSARFWRSLGSACTILCNTRINIYWFTLK